MKNSLDRKILDTFFINSIVFDNNPIKVIKEKTDEYKNIDKDNRNILMNRILSTLTDFVIEYNGMQFLDDYMVQNIYTIINYVKDNYNYSGIEDKQHVYNLRNKMISMLNNYFGDNNGVFYLSQLDLRKIYFDCSYKIDEFNIPDTIKDSIRSSLSLDHFFYNLLIRDRENISDKTINTLKMNTMFIYSVNYFSIECSNVLEKNMVLKEILLANKKIINSLNFKLGFKKEEYDKTKCLIKSTKQLLNEMRWS
ncbi:MAG: hypothetical protein HFI86_05045 [Bacilli bacterium]|nr:hypothetical protein [Bacilli bacterium]